MNTLKTWAGLLGVLAGLWLLPSTPVDAANSFKEAIEQGQANLVLRYRFEGVDQDGFPEDATANTVLTRLTLKTGDVKGLSAVIEFDHVAELIDKDYNDTINGNTDFPVIADPSGSDMNQAYLQYQATPDTKVRVGRQRIIHNNQRFVGGVPWRQNEQTFDGARILTKVNDKLSVDYSYSYNVNRIFGSRSPNGDLETALHLLDVVYKPAQGHSIEAFAYHMDFDDALALSNQTFGVDYQFQTKVGDMGYKFTGTYATQSDAGDNPFDYSTEFYKLDLEASFGGFRFAAGTEVLGSDNGRGFITPLATLHLFQGFADLFLNTPPAGIEDRYIRIGAKLAGINMTAFYHQFEAEEGSIDYGDEFNFVATYAFSKQYSMLVKYAKYNADEFAVDTEKVWLQFVARY